MHQLKVKHVPKPVCQRAAVQSEREREATTRRLRKKQTNFVLKWFWPEDKLSTNEHGLA